MPNGKEVMTARTKLVMLLVVLASPFILAYVAFHFWKPSGSVNYGELMPTKPVPVADLRELAPGTAEAIKDKWLLLTVDSGKCEAACVQKLYLMRQVRATQGKYLDRVARVYVVDDESVPGADAMTSLEGTALLASTPAFLQALPAAGDRHAHIYLIDPIGNLVLRYPANPDSGGMIKDLARVLAVSKLGN
jgi:hypothetical protein